jgi:hypothetical protein
MGQQEGVAFLNNQFIADVPERLKVLGLARTDIGGKKLDKLNPL